ncbi:MAG: hypothetical protein P8L85_06010 [Rubripirellula sp.]|nr:hypothetical protein [Rubripirellula sp.]
MICLRRDARHQGFSLLEIIAAVTIAVTLTVISISYFKPAKNISSQRSCDLTRQVLQNDADRYYELTGQLASTDLHQLKTKVFSGTTLPKCPDSDKAYTRNASGVVSCPTHEATRKK